ncbi:alpha/beta fold hydrolase [Dyella telluris]|uniref:Alpha/beta hydrolase n=1 Tax=Dyella telluris TaxID=2763498 RepID=A0A7G8Q3H4_9GAMM|nr:alpha/beta hydrolase [Dyella telluris]QNK01332.1 alpha/beta hydrolase [Dyella telluris]
MSKIQSKNIQANGINQYFIEAGEGAPVVLLHGFPETNYGWRHQIAALSRQYRVIAPDLRGYGKTDKPVDGYDKRNMALDLRELMRALSLEKVALVGHDRGARVATRFAKDHPEALDRLVVMDNVPTRIVAREFNAKMAKVYWFFMFHLVPDLPEALIEGREEAWLRYFFSAWSHNKAAFTKEDIATYVDAYRQPGAVRGALADYRANSVDVTQDMADADTKIRVPTLSLWGAEFDGVGKMFDMPAVWAEMADDLRTYAVPGAGHLVQEEQPEIVNELLLDFLKGWNG